MWTLSQQYITNSDSKSCIIDKTYLSTKYRYWKGRFPVQPYRRETQRISLFGEHSGSTNHMNTMKFATFLYDTVEVENGHACDGAERTIKS